MPPPPPPPGPPPPPAFNLGGGDSQLGKKEVESRSLLLSSIRQGTQLKKAVTHDRSAPSIGGKSVPVSNKNNNNNSCNDFTRTNGAPQGLGGLFAGGMPKLKSTGQRHIDGHSTGPFMPPNKKTTAPSPPLGRSNQTATQVPPTTAFSGSMKRGFANDRGPAPQPPPPSNKPIISGTSTMPLPRKGPPLPSKPPVQINKPAVGPRPTQPGNKPAPPLKGPSLPANPPNLKRPVSLGEHDYRNGQLVRGNALASSASRLNGTSTNQHPPSPTGGTMNMTRNLVAQFNANQTNQQKQMAPPLPPPPPSNPPSGHTFRTAAPPPPLRTTTAPRPPGNRPPPPPNKGPVFTVDLPLPPLPPNVPPALPAHLAAPPPPPPHRTASSSTLSNMARMQPPPPPPTGQPPPPPVRHASTRSSSCPPPRKAVPDNFESRFIHKFRSKDELPPPDSFENCSKTYSNSRRNPAPLPPQVQLGDSMYIRQESKC